MGARKNVQSKRGRLSLEILPRPLCNVAEDGHIQCRRIFCAFSLLELKTGGTFMIEKAQNFMD
jgi:hypothetical protein